MRETTRPAIYRTMKYWGKKPHNIWGNYISKYCPKGGIVLDPFVGSGMTYFETLKAGRIPITIDINPVSDISIKCLTKRNINVEELSSTAKKIISEVEQKDFYKNEYTCKCEKCCQKVEIYNYKINGNSTVTYKCENCGNVITKQIVNYKESDYVIDKWVPTKRLSDIESISTSFLKKIKDDKICNLWTNRNLKILSEIYDLILKTKDEEIKELLVFAFLQCLHLTSKMCIPRNDKSNRPLSTSWGRPAYMLSKKTFEQNPLLAFEKAVFNGTVILKAINSIIQYGDLSEVWVSWLEHYRREYTIDHKHEIIVNKNKSINDYKNALKNTFIKINRVLKNEGNFILTFNSNKKEDWDSLLYAIKNSDFYVEKIVYQKNKRSSEANVKAKEGIAISDYYLLCRKGKWVTDNISNFLDNWGIDL